MTAAIEFTDLSYSYPDGRKALQNISLSIQPGERVALLGANGAGKSTLLLHLNGILQGRGSVSVSGLPVIKPNLGLIRALVGMVFQSPDDQLFSPTVFEDVAYGPIYQGLPAAEIGQRVESALTAVEMQTFQERMPHHLSLGEKKRIAIATVLSMQPEILAFDEPTAGMDPRARRSLISLLYSFTQTLLIATHDLNLARELLPRSIVLAEGGLVYDGRTNDLLADATLLERVGLA